MRQHLFQKFQKTEGLIANWNNWKFNMSYISLTMANFCLQVKEEWEFKFTINLYVNKKIYYPNCNFLMASQKVINFTINLKIKF